MRIEKQRTIARLAALRPYGERSRPQRATARADTDQNFAVLTRFTLSFNRARFGDDQPDLDVADPKGRALDKLRFTL